MQKEIETKINSAYLAIINLPILSPVDKSYQKRISNSLLADFYLSIISKMDLNLFIKNNNLSIREYDFVFKNSIFYLFTDAEIIDYIKFRLGILLSSGYPYANRGNYVDIFYSTHNRRNQIDKKIATLYAFAYRDYNRLLTQKLVNEGCKYIKEGKILSEFKSINHLDNIHYGHIFSSILSNYSDEELINYFSNSLSLLCDKDNKFTYIRYESGFRRVTDIAVNTHYVTESQKRLKALFKAGYKRYMEQYCWPKPIINEAIQKIMNFEPLAYLGERYYTDRTIPEDYTMIEFLDNQILSVVGEKKFSEYCDYFCSEFTNKDSLREYEHGSMNFPLYLMYIFGIEYKATKRFGNSKAIRICYISVLPHIINGLRDAAKDKIFRKYKLTESEIETINIKAKEYRYSNNVFHTYKDFNIPRETILRYEGVCLEDIFSYMDRWFENNYLDFKCNHKYFGLKDIFFDCDNDAIKMNYDFIFVSRSQIPIRNAIQGYKNKKISEYNTILLKNNSKEIFENKNIYTIFYYSSRGSLTYTHIDISKIKIEKTKEYIREYIRYEYSTGLLSSASKRRIFQQIIQFFEYIEKTFGMLSLEAINDVHILSYCQYLFAQKQISETSIAQILSTLNIFIDFVIDETDSSITINHSRKITLKHVFSHLKSTPVIPDEILVYLDNHIKEVNNNQVSLIYELASWTAFRFEDIRNAKAMDLDKINNDVAKITISTSKTRAHLRKKGLTDLIHDYIPVDLYNKLLLFIEETKSIRMKYEIETIFFSIVQNKALKYNVASYNRTINNFLKQRDIYPLDGKKYDFASRQQRKTVACSLINNGASASSVQQKLGHITKTTTQKYYIEVDRMKLNELNHEFFNKQFNYLVGPERLALYSEEERRVLYKDFCLRSRETELGVCTLHPSEGRCSVHINGTCSTCSKICTGKKWLDKWIKLRDDSSQYLSELLRVYTMNNIPETEYSSFIEYKQEKRLFDHYSNIIKLIMEKE